MDWQYPYPHNDMIGLLLGVRTEKTVPTDPPCFTKIPVGTVTSCFACFSIPGTGAPETFSLFAVDSRLRVKC